MKKNFGREIAFLSLPVLFFGGGALLRSMNGRVALPSFLTSNPFDPGPMRLEFSSFKTVDVSPRDAADGFDWATQTSAQIRGQWDMPKGWKETVRTIAAPTSVRMVYRRGNHWQFVPQPKVGPPKISLGLNGDTSKWTLQADLEDVPRNVDEVRLRGAFVSDVQYSGTIPTGWKVPQNLRIVGVHRILTVKSKTFDVQIKGPNEPMPAPDVSRDTKVELVRAVWFTEAYSNGDVERFFLQLRHKEARDWSGLGPSVRDVKVFDATGRELKLFDKNGTGKLRFSGYSGVFNQGLFSPELPSTDRIEAVFSDDTAPRGGWSGVKQPIRLEMKISDGKCWPLQARVVLKHQSNFNQKTLGAPGAPNNGSG